MSERFFEPKRANKDQQDVQWNLQSNDGTLQGASGNPGSAVGYKVAGSGTGYAYEQTGFVGTKQPPEDTSPAQPTLSLAVTNNNTASVTVTATLSNGASGQRVFFQAREAQTYNYFLTVTPEEAVTNAEGKASATFACSSGEVHEARVWAICSAASGSAKTTINVT
jgi:hypothetical protein